MSNRKISLAEVGNRIEYWRIYLPTLTEETINNMDDNLLESIVNGLEEGAVSALEEKFISENDPTAVPSFIGDTQKEEEDIINKINNINDLIDNDLEEQDDTPIKNDIKYFDEEVEEVVETVKEIKPVKTTKITLRDDINSDLEPEPQVYDDVNTEPLTPPPVKDLFNLSVTDASVSSVMMNYDSFLSKTTKSTYYVILPVSGYTANVRGMTVSELNANKTSSTSKEDRIDTLYKTVYNCIVDSSIGKFTFSKFIAMTAQTEVSLLLFGIMVKTFGSINTISFNCRHCNTVNDNINMDLNSLIQIKSDILRETLQLVDLKENPKSNIENSLLEKLDVRFELPVTKVIVSAKFSPLSKDNEVAVFKKKMEIDDDNIIAELLHFVSRVYVPVLDKSGEHTNGKYASFTTTRDIYHFLKDMPLEDLKHFSRELNPLNEYTISFSKSVACVKCSEKSDVTVDIIPNFFYSIFQQMT